METKEPTPTIVHNYYGITFQDCSMPNATIQTISQPSADTRRAPDAPMPEAACPKRCARPSPRPCGAASRTPASWTDIGSRSRSRTPRRAYWPPCWPTGWR